MSHVQQKVTIHASGAVAFAAGVPAYTWQSGQFTGVITDTGVGDITLNMNANDGIDAAECAVIISMCALTTYPRRTSAVCVHTSDIAKQILISSEGAAGVASAAADENFEFAIFRNNIL